MAAKRRNLNAIYTEPLPVPIIALPPLIVHHPISIAHYLYALIVAPVKWKYTRKHRHMATVETYTDSVSTHVSSIFVDSTEDMQALWKAGFFGKGTQSRSNPTWEIRTAKRLQAAMGEDTLAPEEVTAFRRAARRKFKNARAIAEAGGEAASETQSLDAESEIKKATLRKEDKPLRNSDGSVVSLEKLQLTYQEAFFLAYGLDCLEIYDDKTGDRITVPALLTLLMPDWNPDNSFIVNYVVYHHYRSHGWCIREGVKFGVDYLLYKRGPPLSHAEFGVIVIPVYNDESRNEAIRQDWSWSSGVNRVVSGAKKTLVFCYVQIPDSIYSWLTFDELLRRYSVREVTYKRWIPSRNRD
ncbi:SEN2 subunit of the tRNA splicing endonuclease-like protein [Lipomyces arxii]|uniref:SEN2 subunit of the tRNA splicing endonuclease-like protein n=1 Tax=Lipomyces arxii TaxID=56418 RepID=UPI0034CFD7B5